jgi:hypothetical protein
VFVEGFGRGLPREHLAGSAVERGSDGVDLFGRPSGQVGALREVLAEKSVGVLVRAALPWALGVGEEDGDVGLDREVGVGGELLASVPSERAAELV